MKLRVPLLIAATVTVLAGIAVVGSRTGVLSEAAPGNVNAQASSGTESSAQSVFDVAPVRQGDLTAEKEFKATVSFGSEWTIATEVNGLITQQRMVGETVEFGDELIRVDDRPLTYAKGAMPMYRDLEKVDTRQRDEFGNRVKLLNGPDVKQLQQFLLENGFDVDGKLIADGEFGSTTAKAVEAWQEYVGLTVSGRVDSSQLVFGSEVLRIASDSRVGARFETLTVSLDTAAVLVDTSNRDRGALVVDSSVEIELADGSLIQGTIAKQEQVTASDGSRVWRTTVEVAGSLPTDASTATVTVLEIVANNVLIVPVGSLLALAEGGFGVEVVTQDDAEPAAVTTPGTKIVAVEVGEVLAGQAEVDGAIQVGDRVVVVK